VIFPALNWPVVERASKQFGGCLPGVESLLSVSKLTEATLVAFRSELPLRSVSASTHSLVRFRSLGTSAANSQVS
jgi:hypothetical protein